MLNSLEIKGEISNLKYHSSGHIYFTLKDEASAIKCVMFSSYTSSLKFKLTDGMLVVCQGAADVYERDGSYQIYVKAIRQEGLGNLFEEYEKLKEKLFKQGMFDPMFKRPIPKHIKTLGVVTASTGAAVRDIIDVSKRRNPGILIILYPAIVQGSDAPESIVKGIKELEAYGVDTIIVGRGGGSIEDLWGFNDEGVAQAIFDCSVPIISAIGHETDFTIADFVSDLRAPTPSAAAELAVSDEAQFLRELQDKRNLLNKDIRFKINDCKQEIFHLGQRLNNLNPKLKILKNREKLEYLKNDCIRTMNDKLLTYKNRLSLDAGALHGLSPLTKLSSGYSYVEGSNGKALKSIKDVKVNEKIRVNVTDGSLIATVEDIE